jgi:UDP-N-acetylglucosamine--N-acetylmuramyl-(pentapeptide) pyrophosphoryl-undecaprenol N-acetylglucosamine transferase
MPRPSPKPLIAIACGGTGGHLFPGLAVAGKLLDRGCEVMVMISPKEVDQQAVTSATDTEVVILPAVPLNRGRVGPFVRGFIHAFRETQKIFRKRKPGAVLAMGGFTSAPPVLAGKLSGAATFLHESNTIPGRANRWIARVVNQAFVGFSQTAPQLATPHVVPTGTPVRPQFQPADPGANRLALGLQPDRPLLLVQGGSQGAHGVNNLLVASLPRLASSLPGLQFLHLTGEADFESVKAAYARHGCKARVLPFLTEMELALGAATLAISRAGGSSLAEFAAMRVPSILIPYPAAIDNHQYWNAKAFEDAGAARLLEEKLATPDRLGSLVEDALNGGDALERMRQALARWDSPYASELIADKILAYLPGHDSSRMAFQTHFEPRETEPDIRRWSAPDRIEFRPQR